MSIQMYQLYFTIPLFLLVVIVWKVKNTKLKLFLILTLCLLALFNPLRFKQDGVGGMERFKSKTTESKGRIVVEEQNFQEKQRADLEELKKESIGVKNESNY